MSFFSRKDQTKINEYFSLFLLFLHLHLLHLHLSSFFFLSLLSCRTATRWLLLPQFAIDLPLTIHAPLLCLQASHCLPPRQDLPSHDQPRLGPLVLPHGPLAPPSPFPSHRFHLALPLPRLLPPLWQRHPPSDRGRCQQYRARLGDRRRLPAPPQRCHHRLCTGFSGKGPTLRSGGRGA